MVASMRTDGRTDGREGRAYWILHLADATYCDELGAIPDQGTSCGRGGGALAGSTDEARVLDW